MFRPERAPTLSAIEQRASLEEVDFEQCGGQVLEYNEDDRPTHWICGQTEKGEPVHPPDAPEDAVLYLATCPETKERPQWRGATPDHLAVSDKDQW